MTDDHAARLRELCTTWLGWFDADEDDDQPWFPDRRGEIADHLRDVTAALDELGRLSAAARPADADPEYARWLTRNLHAAFAAGWATHADLVTGTLATLGAEKRRQCGKAWVAERLADLSTDEPPVCKCGCPLGQPCGCDEDVDHDPASLDAAHETGMTWDGDQEVTF